MANLLKGKHREGLGGRNFAPTHKKTEPWRLGCYKGETKGIGFVPSLKYMVKQIPKQSNLR